MHGRCRVDLHGSMHARTKFCATRACPWAASTTLARGGAGHLRQGMADTDTDDGEERALARRDEGGVATADAYEREYMKGEGVVLYRAKQRTPWQMTALIAAVGVVSMWPLFLGTAGAWISTAITLPILFLIWVLMGVLRVTVSQGAVDVQYGLFGPRIPIAAIEAAAPTEYKWTTVGGWGVRRGPGGSWVYNMPGDGGKAVRIEWRDAKGRKKVTIIGSRSNLELFRAIEQARRALPQPAQAGVIENAAPRRELRAGDGEGEGEGEP